MKSKSFWRIALAVMIVGLLAFGGTLVGLAGADGPFGPILLGNDDFESGAFGEPDPSCAWLVGKYGFPEDCDLMGVKINDPTTGSFDDQTGKVEFGCDATDFDVELTIDENKFDFVVSGYTVYYVWVKAGPGGHLYGYPDGTQSEIGLISPVSDDISHITFYYCDDPLIPAIDIEKATNGEDADEPTGPHITVGEDVVWTYVVTNTGNVELTNIVVTDDEEGEIGTIDSLAPGASETLTKTGTAEAGQYANIATVEGNFEDTTVSDSDPSHYFGTVLPTGSVTINKIVVDDDGDVIEDDETFSITLTGPEEYSNTFNVEAGQTVTINGLPLGNYTVTEADKEGYELISITPEEELDVDNLNISFTIINELIFEEIIVVSEDPEVNPEDPEVNPEDSEVVPEDLEVNPEDSEENNPLPQTNGTALPLMGLGILFTGIGILSKRRK